jgi:Tol biopolymer transport system component
MKASFTSKLFVLYFLLTKKKGGGNIMRSKRFVWVFLVLALVFVMQGSMQQSAEQLYQAGLYAEEVEGDLQKAIQAYTKVIEKFGDNKEIAADAQLHIGFCYEKLGRTEAIKAYEQVLENYAGQAKQVAEARVRLAALRKEEPAGLTMNRLLPPEVYLECQTLSPDGTKVAGIDFSKGQNVAVYDLAAGKLQFITNYDWKGLFTYVTIWSPDGREIAYQAGSFGAAAQQLWTSTLSGKSRMLFKNPHGNVAPCDWLEDGSAVLAVLENENNTYSLGLVSVKEGSFRELYRLHKAPGQKGDPAQAEAGASADVSPDGRLIAFSDGPQDGGRNIFILPTKGGAPDILIDHPADDREPRWSPDGRHIVFLSNRHGSWALWGIEIQDGKSAGEPFMALEGMEDAHLASWTKKGLLSRTSAVVRDIYSLEIDPQSFDVQGKPHILNFTPSGSNFRPQWSPDGKYLAFVPFQNLSGQFPSSIFVMPAEGGKARKFENPSGIWQWQPDSSGLWFFGQDEEKRPLFKRLELESGEWKTVSIPGAELPKPGVPSIAFSGDGKTFFYIKMGQGGSEPGIIAYDLETGRERYLLRKQPDEPQYFTVNASRDHKRLVTGLLGRILIVDVDTGNVERLEYEKENLTFPAWSPDGKHLAAVGRTREDGDFNEIFIISLTDGKVKSLDVSRYFSPGMRIMFTLDWSPDGKTIAYDTFKIISETNLIQNVIPKK